MTERWRVPVVPLDINQSEHEGIVTADGRVMRQPVLVLKPEDMERMRAGYVCMKCLEPFEQAWPVRCPVCGAPVRTRQADYFAMHYDPSQIQLGPSTTLEEERARLPELRAKEKEAGNGNHTR